MPAITVADIKLLTSARMTDLSDGGGLPTSTAVQDGADNNVFPDVSDDDTAWGKLNLRLLYVAVTNSGTDALLGANLVIAQGASSSSVDAFTLGAAAIGESRADALSRLQVPHWEPLGPSLSWNSPTQIDLSASVSWNIVPGMVIFSEVASGTFGNAVMILTSTDVTPVGATTYRRYSVTYDGARGTVVSAAGKLGVPSPSSPWLGATRVVAGGLSSGAEYADLPSLLVSVIPKSLGSIAGDPAQVGIDGSRTTSDGRAVGFRAGQTVVVHHTQDTTPATVANGATIDCGRTNLYSAVLIGADGGPIYSGYTVNRTTGLISVTNTSGWSQPVKARHTIGETLGITRTGYSEVRGGVTSFGGTASTVGPFTLPVSGSLSMYCGRSGVGRARVISRSGQDITDLVGNSQYGQFRWFTVDAAAGTVNFTGPYFGGFLVPDQSSFVSSHSPVTLQVSGQSAATSSPTDPGPVLNRVTFNRPLSRDYPAGVKVSTVQRLGDLQANVSDAYSQGTWTDVWQDTRIGSPIAAQYDDVGHPIVVTNAGAIPERWAIIFTTTTAFRLVGETVGQIATGTINSTLAPNNPATGVPYFTLAPEGWGSGWAQGNAVRFNTRGPVAPVWAARSILPSAPTGSGDSITYAVRGGINT